MILDPPWWATLLLEIGSGALVAVGVFTLLWWWDGRKKNE